MRTLLRSNAAADDLWPISRKRKSFATVRLNGSRSLDKEDATLRVNSLLAERKTMTVRFFFFSTSPSSLFYSQEQRRGRQQKTIEK